jgi:2-polyprenyl-3-methyl-5-hydroxy-6-metoxy-1,4-benzoquinol methylase
MVISKTSFKYARATLDEVLKLFPENVKYRCLDLNYYEYLWILKTTLPYLKEGAKILDVGAGAGVISLVFRKMGFDVYAIDTWEEYDEKYDNRMGIKEDIIERLEVAGIHLRYCNILKDGFPFAADNFDVILLLDVIEHLSAPKTCLQEIKRVLRKNGYLVITTPNLATLKNRVCVLLGRSNHVELKDWYNSVPFFGHIREYTIDEVKQMFVREDFTVVTSKLSNCLQLPVIKKIRSNPVEALTMVLYLILPMFIHRLRYGMIVIAQQGVKKK